MKTVEALVLESRPYGESHRIVTLLVKEYGVMAAMAYGAGKQQSPLAAGTRSLTRGLFLLRPRERGLADLLQVETLSLYPRTRADMFRSAYAQAVMELATVLGREPGPPQGAPLFDETMGALERLEQGAPVRLTMAHLFARLPELAGLSVTVSQCAICGRPLEGVPGLRFLFSAGGLVCPECARHGNAPVWNTEAARMLAAMTNAPVRAGVGSDDAAVAVDVTELILRTLAAYWAESGGIVLKSWQVIVALDP